jgi:hypothetical protein
LLVWLLLELLLFPLHYQQTWASSLARVSLLQRLLPTNQQYHQPQTSTSRPHLPLLLLPARLLLARLLHSMLLQHAPMTTAAGSLAHQVQHKTAAAAEAAFQAGV